MSEARARPSPVVLVAAGAGVLVAVAVRLFALGRLPGINGDEAWYGVQALRLLDGGAWNLRTPTGNLPGPLHLGALTLLHAVAPPSFTLLRLPTVLASLAQCAATWLVVRRHLGAPAAAVAVTITAFLPVDVAYARFGWDPSWSGLVAILAIHFALSGAAWACAASFALALLVHPTNVFLAPTLVLAYLGAAAGRSTWPAALRRTGLLVALLVGVLPLLAWTSGRAAASTMSAGAAARLFSPSSWAELVVLFLRLLTGDTVLAYITGEGLGRARLPAELAIGIALVALLVAGIRTLRAASAEAGLVAGWLASLFAFGVLVGPAGLRPHVERYGLTLVVPTVLAVTVLVREVAERGRRWAVAWGAIATAAVAATLAIAVGYLGALERTRSTSHETFWTGPVEPKGEALRLVEAEARQRGGARLVPESFWLHMPIAYLAHGGPVDVRAPAQVDGPVPPGGTYWVGFAGGELEGLAARGNTFLVERWSVPGADGGPAVRVWWTPAEVRR
jgi:hypothetical protein